MRNLSIPKTKICRGCQRELPLTAEYFRRFKGSRDGFQARCKDCNQTWIREHYVHFTELDFERRGSVGVKCPLYSPKCGKCLAVPDCWRLVGLKPGDDRIP